MGEWVVGGNTRRPHVKRPDSLASWRRQQTTDNRQHIIVERGWVGGNIRRPHVKRPDSFGFVGQTTDDRPNRTDQKKKTNNNRDGGPCRLRCSRSFGA